MHFLPFHEVIVVKDGQYLLLRGLESVPPGSLARCPVKMPAESKEAFFSLLRNLAALPVMYGSVYFWFGFSHVIWH